MLGGGVKNHIFWKIEVEEQKKSSLKRSSKFRQNPVFK